MASDVQVHGQGQASTTLTGDVTFSYKSDATLGKMNVLGDVVINGGSYNLVYDLYFRDMLDINYGSGHMVDNCSHYAQYYNGRLDVYSTYVDAYDYYNTSGTPPRGVQGGSATLYMEGGQITHKDYGVYAALTLNADFDYVVFGGNTIDAYAASGATVNLTGCTTFSDCPPPTSGPGTITYTNCSVWGGAKATAPKASPTAAGDEKAPPDKKLYNEARRLVREVMQSRREARRNDETFDIQQHRGQLDQAVRKLKELASKYPDSESIIPGFQLMSFIWNDLGESEQFTPYASDLKKKSMSDPFRYGLLQGEAHSRVSRGEFEHAVSLYDEMAGLNVSTDLKENALYGKGVVCQYFIGDKERAEGAYTQVLALNSETGFAEMIASDRERLHEGLEPEPEADPEARITELNLGNYPNPGNPNTTIYYALPDQGRVAIRVYDVMGRQVQVLVNSIQPAGKYEVKWNGKDSRGNQAASGMYFYQLQFEDRTMTKKMLLVR